MTQEDNSMGMLMHHTWLEQQKKAEKPVVENKAEETAKEEPEAEPVKKTGGRRKASK